jgi:hypothetical protein
VTCSSNCPTRDHESWGACVKAKGIRAQWLGGTGPSQSEQKAFSAENEHYRQALRDGLTPDSVRRSAVDAAYETASKG